MILGRDEVTLGDADDLLMEGRPGAVGVGGTEGTGA
jgi:hypothetical protein